ncbi:glycosyltransferase family 4 protein [Candidatus Gottesmanbacteria bacterium]|nr:glycosyltransferase family 4 protein [Candidatus Gottesmanbacteria bacterium]
MKIVHLIDYFQPKVGYQEYFLAREHTRLGHDVTVVTSSMYFPFPNYDKTYKSILGKRVVPVGKRYEEGILTVRLRSIEIVPSSVVYLHGLKKVLQEISPDILFCHGVFSLTAYLAAFWKKDIGYKLVYDTHAAAFNTNLTNSLTKRLYFMIYESLIWPKIVRWKDFLFAVGNNERDFLYENLRVDKRKVPIIHLGVDPYVFTYNSKKRLFIRRELGLTYSDILIIFTGKISPNKEIHTLIQAVNSIQNSRIKILLLGGGDGAYIKYLNRIDKRKCILYHQMVKNSQLPGYFSAADIGCWPGDFSISIFEAMASSLPLIVANVENNAFLKDRVLRYNIGDWKNLANKITLLVSNKKFRMGLGKASRVFAQEFLSWSVIAKKTLDSVS